MQRRGFLTASLAGATAATLKVASAATEGPFGETGVPVGVPRSERLPLGPLSGSRYPDAHIEALDKKRFKGSVGTGAVERVATGMRWAEGPAYFAAGRYLVFSDIPNNRMMRLSEDDNHLSVFRYPSFNSNGNHSRSGGTPGQYALRCRGQCLVQHGFGGPQRRWCALLRIGWRSVWQDPCAGDRGQLDLRRNASQSAVHLWQHLDLRVLCQHARSNEAVTKPRRPRGREHKGIIHAQ